MAFLTESIVKPDAFVPNTYRAVQLEMKSGPNVSGIRLNEDDISIQLRDANEQMRGRGRVGSMRVAPTAADCHADTDDGEERGAAAQLTTGTAPASPSHRYFLFIGGSSTHG